MMTEEMKKALDSLAVRQSAELLVSNTERFTDELTTWSKRTNSIIYNQVFAKLDVCNATDVGTLCKVMGILKEANEALKVATLACEDLYDAMNRK